MAQDIEIRRVLYSSKSDKKFAALFLLGILVYELSNIFMTIEANNLFRIFQFAGVLTFSFSARKLVKWNKRQSYFKTIFTINLIWNLIIIVRLQEFSAFELQKIIFQPIHFFSYFVPFVSLFTYNISLIKKLNSFALILTIIFPLLFGFISTSLERNYILDLVVATLIPGACLLVITWKYHKPKIRYFTVGVLALALFAGAVAGRRNIILTITLFLAMSWMINIFYYNRNQHSKKYILFLSTILFAILFFINIDITKISQFQSLTERLDTDSRSGVFLAFFQDLNGLEWVFGRGIDGTYYNPMKYWKNGSSGEGIDITFRDNIENGYLFLILKGGLISLILFLSLSLPAIYLGIFKSKNALSKAFAIFIFIYILDMFTFGQASLSIKYILVWASIGICYNPTLRNMPELEIRKILDQKNGRILK